MASKLFNKPQKVINRWTRIKTYKRLKKIKPFIDRVILFKLRLKLNKESSIQNKAIDNTLNTILKEYERTDGKKFHCLKEIYNISLFILLAEKDFQSMKVDAFTHKDPWKRNLSIRLLLLIINERDLNKVASGKTMKEIYEYTNLSENLRKSIIESIREMKKVQQKAEYEIQTIRHNTIAHRDEDAMLQYQIIKDIDIMKYSNLLTQYYKASNTFISLLPKLMKEVGTFTSLTSQYLKNKSN